MKLKYIYPFALLLFLSGNGFAADTINPEYSHAKMLVNRDELAALKLGWQKKVITVNHLKRKLLWKGPKTPWKNGVIIALHGGGGDYTNFTNNIPLTQAMVNFSNRAIKNGFAVIALDSTWGEARDEQGRSYGKRWDSIAQNLRPNIDLAFIRTVLDKVIPKLRPRGSARNVFIAGISNGGYMTILAATHFPQKITAFASISAGDPYGTYIDLDTVPKNERPNAPGVFRDNETNKMISVRGAAYSIFYPNEKPWPSNNTRVKPVFQLFHHQGDAIADISNMQKAQKLLRFYGYKGRIPFVLRSNIRSVWNHFWLNDYNRPLINFFIETRRKQSRY